MRRDDPLPELEAIHPACFGWALACCDGNRDEAEEVLQVAYLRVIDGRARFDGLSSLKTWFFGVVRVVASERRRARIVRSFALTRWLQGRAEPAPARSPERESREAEQREHLRRMLARLTRRQRDLLHLVFYQELTIEQAAGVLGLRLGTARTHYARGKARIKNMLAETESSHGTERASTSRSVCRG